MHSLGHTLAQMPQPLQVYQSMITQSSCSFFTWMTPVGQYCEQMAHFAQLEKSTWGLSVRQLPVWAVANVVATGPSSALVFPDLAERRSGGFDIAFTSTSSEGLR